VKYGFEKITCLAMIALAGMTSAVADQMLVVVMPLINCFKMKAMRRSRGEVS
jgi:hypothetical protein